MLGHYARSGRLLPACKAAGVDYSYHFRRLQNDPVYRAAFEETEQAAAQRQEDNVCEMADEGDLQAALALLRRFRPNLYRDRSSVEVAVTVDLVQRIQQGHQRVIEMRKATDAVDRVG